MSKILDLSVFKQETLDIKLPDSEEVLHLRKPTKSMVIKMMEFKDLRNDDASSTIINRLNTILGTWVSLKLSASAKLKNVGAAWDEAVKSAKLTVGELKQTIVDDLKAAHTDGKLTDQEIAQLKTKLLDMSVEKMSKPAYDILIAASVDVEALIMGAGQAFIDEIKRNTSPLLVEGVALTTE